MLYFYHCNMDLLDTDVYGVVGQEGFGRLCAAFFRRLPEDDLLRPMYEPDFAGARQRLTDFLIGRFGGPDTYVQQRGHPRLRMRHARFDITPAARDRWVALMTEAMAECELPDEARRKLTQFFDSAGTFMINRE